MGGTLEIKAVFRDAEVSVEIQHFQDLEAPSKRRPEKHAVAGDRALLRRSPAARNGLFRLASQ